MPGVPPDAANAQSPSTRAAGGLESLRLRFHLTASLLGARYDRPPPSHRSSEAVCRQRAFI
jgi:hypothetical protein